MKQAERRKFHYIYKTTRTDGSGKYYIGMHSTDDMDDGYFGSGNLLAKSIKKHGKEKHAKEILEFAQTRKELKLREREIVNEEIVNDVLCMNLRLGCEGWENAEASRATIAGNKSPKRDHKEASKKSLSAKEKRGNANFFGGKYGAFVGKAHTPETKAKIGAANRVHQLGEKNSQFGKCWVFNSECSITIRKEFLEEYLLKGFSKGRKIKLSEFQSL